MTLVFIALLSVFALIGISSSFKKKNNSKDYLLAGQDVPPWLVALSAVATNNSGYMFIGMIGYTYKVGLQSIWLMVGWVIGDFIGSMLVYGKLKPYSEKFRIFSFGSLIANNKGQNSRVIQLVAGLISLIFLSSYAAAQFSAGGKALSSTFGWSNTLGVVLGAGLVVAYCFSGGIRASIWTDAAQSIVMIFSMGMLLYVAVNETGGWSDAVDKLQDVNTDYLAVLSKNKSLSSALLFAFGWLFAGFGVVGQPHIMVRYMTLDKPENIKKVRWFYYPWYIAFYAMAIGVGLMARITLPASEAFDPELALPMMSMQLLPDYLVGVMLAGIFAATISTADSLVISCTASLSNDIFPRFKHNYKVGKMFTIGIALFAIALSLLGNKSVFEIVIYSWAILGTVFGPVITLRMLGKEISQASTLTMMILAGGTTILWNMVGLSSVVYEMLPGICVGFLVYFGMTAFSSNTATSGNKGKTVAD